MTFEELEQQILNLQGLPNTDFFIVGYSTLNQPIYCIHIGSYEGAQILVEGSIHAREYPAALLLVQMIEYTATQNFEGGIYVIPLVNPDGVRIVLNGPLFIGCENQRQWVRLLNNNSSNFSQWKANINGVDLNVNFDALWGGGVQNVFCPAPANFVGNYPNSEREVRLLIDFTLEINPALTLSFHTKGNVIFYGFETLNSEQLARDLEIANTIGRVNGYQVVKTENSTGGYSDWVSMHLGVPAFTIEVGSYQLPTPIPLTALPEAFSRNRDVLIVALQQAQAISN